MLDFDDAIFLGPNGQTDSKRKKAFDDVCKRASHVVAGNQWLAAHVQNPNVTVIPTCIDTKSYIERSPSQQALPRIGWIGTHTNIPYLNILLPSLLRLRKSGLAFKFVVCSNERPTELMRQIDLEFIPWSKERELGVLQAFDIGVMPLADEPWTRGKCSFKMIQYMAVGTPVVGSRVGFNIDVVSEGQDGFLVNDTAWDEAIALLLQNSDRRKKMGQAARQKAVQNFDIQRAVKGFDEILSRLC